VAADVDVLVVGAGPVGLLLATECARRGLRWRLVEAHPTQSIHSKALAIFSRTLEVLDMAGLLGAAGRAAARERRSRRVRDLVRLGGPARRSRERHARSQGRTSGARADRRRSRSAPCAGAATSTSVRPLTSVRRIATWSRSGGDPATRSRWSGRTATPRSLLASGTGRERPNPSGRSWSVRPGQADDAPLLAERPASVSAPRS
jgi:glycine/D-amino acid oxidase-like deaminating enzyme